MKTVAVLTAVYDNYDPLRDLPAQSQPHEAICITDNPNLTSGTWDVRHEPRPDVHPNRAAKRPKCEPWRYTDADITIWVDASFDIKSHLFVEELAMYGPWAHFIHPDRDCLYAEANVSLGMHKYAGEPLEQQKAFYFERGHPEHWGLWATGLIVRHRTPQVEVAGAQWAEQIECFSFQDQVSEPFVLRNADILPVTIPGAYSQNQWMLYAGSSRH